jgi:hypothetical protein
MLYRRFSILYLTLPLIFALALVFSCGEQPTGIENKPTGGLNGKGTIDPGANGRFFLGSVTDTFVTPGRIEVWAMNVAFNDSTGIVTFDVQLLNLTQHDIFPPVHFVITSIQPRDISVVDFDGVSGDSLPFYDFSGKLGGDAVLTPDEWTEPLTMKFHTVTPRSFAIGFRIELGPPAGGGIIVGVVYRDDNQNGVRDRCGRCEPGIPGITVALEKASDGGNFVLITRTDSMGEYRFGGGREGVYKVLVVANPDEWKVTSANPLLVTLIKGPGGKVQDFFGANFGLYPLGPQPPIPGALFGPVIVGPMSRFGVVLDSTFVNPPSLLPVVYYYFLEVSEPPFEMPRIGIVDSAGAWINGEKVFEYYRTEPPDTVYFPPQTIKLREGLVMEGENRIRILTDGNEHAALMWKVSKRPMMR